MRVIKFRQWLGKEFNYWGVGIEDCTFVGPASGGGTNASNTPHQQFTGLVDKNGKEIYEGDILQFENDDKLTFQKIMDFENGRFALRDTFGNFRFGVTDLGKYSVVGNIYENPEFLKQ